MRPLRAMIVVCILAAGCADLKDRPVVTIDRIAVSAPEFEAAYQGWRASHPGSTDRKEFLASFIERKLMLQEAERLGLDRDPVFLSDVERFWEQSLLKLVMARKINEFALRAKVSESQIQEYYQAHRDTDFAGKELDAVRDQIKVLLFGINERLLLQRWMASLRRCARVDIDYGALGISPDY